jgi:2-keto-3-deoxy-L-rhamnonate aldolase RhmA
VNESRTGPGWESPVRTRLRAGEPVIGITISTPSLDVAATAATLGFDFLWVEMEHSPITLETLRHIVLATRGLPAAPFARVPINEVWVAKRVLDAGVHGVVFPFTSTPALAEQAVQACRYPPAGRRGAGASLATSCWPEPDCYADSADRNITVVAVVEEASALGHVDGIAATPGVDVVFLGTGDLSYSFGLRGRQEDPRLDAAAEAIVAAARRHGKAAGTVVRTAEEARRRIDQGFLFLQGCSELVLMEAGARHLLAPLGKGAGRTATSAY